MKLFFIFLGLNCCLFFLVAPQQLQAQNPKLAFELEKRALVKELQQVSLPLIKADKLNTLYKFCVKHKSLTEAQKYAQEELEIRLNLPVDSVQNHKIANLYFGLASLSKSFTLFSQGIDHINQSVVFYQKLNVSPQTQLDLADAYRMASQIYFSCNQPQKAEQFAIQSLLILERYQTESGEKRITALITLANVYSVQYKFDAAQNLLTRALSAQNQLFIQKNVANTDNNKNKTETANTNKTETANETTARIWQAFAKNYEYQGEYKLAADYLDRALLIRKNLYGVSPNLDLAYNMEHLALMETQQSNFKQAKHLFEQSLSIYNQIYGENSPKMAISLAGLANVLRKERKLDSAQVYFQLVLDLYKKDLDSYANKAAEISLTLAHLAIDKKDTLTASKRIKQGLDLLKQQKNLNLKFSIAADLYAAGCIFGDNAGEKWVYFNQFFNLVCQSAEISQLLAIDPEKIEYQQLEYQKIADIGAATQSFEQKIPIFQRIYLNTLNKKLLISGLWHYINFLNIEADKLKKESQKIAFLQEANQCLELFYYCHQQFILGFQTEQDKLMYLLTAEQIFLLGVKTNYQLYISQNITNEKNSQIANFYLEKGLNYSEWAKSVLLQQYWRESELFVGKNQLFQSYKARQYQLLYAEEQFKKNAQSNIGEQNNNSIEFLAKSYDSLRLERKNIGLNGRTEQQLNQIKSPYALTISKLEQEIINPNTAVIAYSGTKDGFYTFQLWAGKKAWFYQKINLDGLIRDFYQHISLQQQSPKNALFRQEYASLAIHLGQILLPNDLPQRINKLIVSPQNNQNTFPLDALLYENPLKNEKDTLPSFKNMPYWVKKAAFSYVYNLQMLDNTDKNLVVNPPAGFKKANIFAFSPDYSQNKDTTDGLRNKLSPLAGAAQELDFLQQQYKGLFLKGKIANETRIKSEMKKYDVIHFAGHALADMNYNWQSKLILNPTADSSLAFANEGFLQMYEVAAMQLNARLVFLSACETGIGQYVAGEGVFSLGKSFFYAGVPAVVMSSWNVNDQNTFRLVSLFYHKLSLGLEKDEALRQAKLAYLNGERTDMNELTDNPANPCFWAGFSLVGDIQPLVLQPMPNVWIWTIAKILGLCLGVYVFFWFIKNRKR